MHEEHQENSEEIRPLLPPDREALRANTLERKSIDIRGIVWLKRLVMVTEEVLYFATPDEDRNVIDFILVKDLVECDCVQDDELARNGMMELVFRTKKDSRNCGRR